MIAGVQTEFLLVVGTVLDQTGETVSLEVVEIAFGQVVVTVSLKTEGTGTLEIEIVALELAETKTLAVALVLFAVDPGVVLLAVVHVLAFVRGDAVASDLAVWVVALE